MSYSECHHIVPGGTWRASLTEGLISLISQFSAHAVCILAAFTNLAVGGVSFAIWHDFWVTLLLGIAMYAASIVLRWVFSRDARRPGLAMGALGLIIGVMVSTGIEAARVQNHRVEMSEWFAGLPGPDRQKVRDKVHLWVERQGASQQQALSIAAALIGYQDAEDYIVLNYCSSADKDLAAIWKDAGAPIGYQP